jgi:hypothetical protein
MERGGSITTHRCTESIQNKISIRYQKGLDCFGGEMGWYIGDAKYDGDYNAWYLSTLHAPIYYCPFCGIKLQ